MRTALRGLVLSGWLAIAATAAAAPPPNDDARARAAQLYREANELVDQQRYRDAEAKYLEAWRLAPSYDISTNLGAVELEVGKPAQAAAHLHYGLAHFPAGGSPARKTEIEERFAKAKAQIGTVRLHVRGPGGADVTGAHVVVDGAPVDDELAVDALFVEPGAHTIEVTHTAYGHGRETARVDRGGEAEVGVTLASDTAAPPSADHVQPSRGGPIWPIPVLAAAGAVLVGVGVGFTVAAANAKSDADARRDELKQSGTTCASDGCAELKDLYATSDHRFNAAALMYAGGGILVIASIGYAIVRPRPQPSTARSVTIVPQLGANVGGAALFGRF